MKKLLHISLLAILGIFFFNSCKKDYSNENGTPVNPPEVKPDLSAKISASVHGFITDESNNAVSGAVITAGTKTATTDKFGYFKISDAQLGKTAAFIKADKAGYFAGYRTFLANEGKETFIRMKLVTKKMIGTVDAVAGGTATTTDGASITLPPNGMVVASSNSSYAGTVHVATHWFNPASGRELEMTMPGDLEGIDTAGYLKVLETYGMMAVELSGDAGELLQIKNSNEATLSFPIPLTMTGTAPASIPLWYFDETNGLWQQEGVATRIANSYVGNVKHFSYWNCDIPFSSSVKLTCQLVDASLHPLANTEVSVFKDGKYTGCHGYTDTAGFIYGKIPANADLSLSVMDPCHTPAYSKSFTTLNNDIDLGAVSINTSTYSVTITGTVIDCNQQPADGYVIITKSSYDNNVVYVKNGAFSVSTLTCGNADAAIVAFDTKANQESTPLPISLVAGTNDLGIISACGIASNFASITYTIDGVPITLSEPLDSVNSYFNTADYITSISTRTIYFIFDGGTIIGNAHSLIRVNISGNQLSLLSQEVNITQDGGIGGFISGSFSVLFNDQNLQTHSLSCNFKARRKS